MKSNLIFACIILGITSCTLLNKNMSKTAPLALLNNHPDMVLPYPPPSNDPAKIPFITNIGVGESNKIVNGPAFITGWSGANAIQIIMGSEAIVITPAHNFTPFSIPVGSIATITANAGASFWGYKLQ